jgi:hypothetical protein
MAAALALGLGASCSRDHSALEKEPTGSGGDGGAATIGVTVAGTTSGNGGFGGLGSPSGGGDPSTSTGDGGEGEPRPEEPDGPTRIVVVHGVADRERVAFCFATTAGEGVDVAPFPVGGLAFARAIDVAVATFPTSGDAVVMLVAGDEGDLEDASCEDLLADPGDTPELEVTALGVVPADALAAPRILVLAATGCMGGEDHENELQEQACGVGYGPFSPTTSLVAASPSRLAADGKVGFQSIGASVAAAPFDVRLRPGLDGVSFLVTAELSWGAAAPFPPSDDRDVALVGVPAQLGAVVTLPGDMNTELAEIVLADAAERADIGTFSNGEAYTMVFVGASPGLGDGPWWRAFDALFIPPD